MSNCQTTNANLLRYYAETERIIHGQVRGAVHQHLLRSGCRGHTALLFASEAMGGIDNIVGD
jgi:hypothetical protein